MKKNVHISIIISGLFVMLFSYNNCEGGKEFNSNDDNTQLTKIIDPTLKDNPLLGSNIKFKDTIIDYSEVEFPADGAEVTIESSEEEKSYFSVMTAEAMIHSFSQITGVPFEYEQEDESGAKRVLNDRFFGQNYLGQTGFYGDVVGNLPSELALSKFNSSNLNSIISLAGSFCEELFEGVDPREETEVHYYEKFFSGNENVDFNNDNPNDQNVDDFIDHLLGKFVPQLNVDENGVNILKDNFNENLEKYNYIRNKVDDYLINSDGNSRSANVQPDSPNLEYNIDFNSSFFVSYHIMPYDPVEGYESYYNSNLYPTITFKHDDDSFQFKHHYKNQELYVIMWLRIGPGYTYKEVKFLVNDPEKNNFKNESYHVVFQYIDSGGDTVDFNNDFKVYVNNKEVEKTNQYNYDLTTVIDKGDIKFFNLSEKVSEGVFSAKNSTVSFRSNSDLSFGSVEVYKGNFDDFLSDEIENEIYFDEYGSFTFSHTKNDVDEKGPDLFFGKIDTGEIYLYSSVGDLTYDNTSNSVTENGLAANSFNLEHIDYSINWPKPFLIFSPLLCSAILSSQYFIFN